MKKKMLKNIEWGIVICTLILITIGLVALYSSTQNSDYEEFKKQIIWFGISIPIIVIIVSIDYEFLAKGWPIFYLLSILLLILVLFTEPINGATSWFSIGSFSLQPAEFAKIAVIITLAKIILYIQKKDKEEINRILKLALVFAVALIPIVLIILQPDYGTALAFIFALIFMLFTANINKKYIVTAIIIVIVSVPLLYFFVLPEHAKSRIDVYLNPNLDPRGAGYNIIQSKLAIGAGQLFGMGWLKGNQTQLGYLYPKTTDFIFAVIGEELGFPVAAIVIIVYILLITKSIKIAKTAKDDLGSYIAIRYFRNFLFSYARKYRNDNGASSYYRNTTSFCKLWRKFNDYKFNFNSFFIKYKCT